MGVCGSTVPAKTNRHKDEIDKSGWSELTDYEQWGALQAGYTKVMWDSNSKGSPEVKPSNDKKDWGELSSSEQEGYNAIGYNRSNWEN